MQEKRTYTKRINPFKSYIVITIVLPLSIYNYPCSIIKSDFVQILIICNNIFYLPPLSPTFLTNAFIVFPVFVTRYKLYDPKPVLSYPIVCTQL